MTANWAGKNQSRCCGFNSRWAMPPKRTYKTPKGVTKRQTRADTKRTASLAGRNNTLVNQVTKSVTKRKNATETAQPSTSGNPDTAEGLASLISSLNDEVQRLQAQKAELEQEAATSATSSSALVQRLDSGIGV